MILVIMRGEESDDRNCSPVPEPIDPERVTEVVGL
jgi:hypothetical protein